MERIVMTADAVRAGAAFLAWGVIAFLCLGVDEAKMDKISLSELVRGSDLVLYGQTARHDVAPPNSDYSIAWIKPLSVLEAKNGAVGGEDLPICNLTDTESVEFNAHPRRYVVFAKKAERCYSPIAGINSVVWVSNKMAFTERIDGQPKKQRLDAFLKEIRS